MTLALVDRRPNITTPRAGALRAWELGLNVTAIAEGDKEPDHEWNSKAAPWGITRQPREIVESLGSKWRTQSGVWNGRIQKSINRFGIINGPVSHHTRSIDIDARIGEDGQKIPIPSVVYEQLATALGLPDEYDWSGPSSSGAGRHLFIRCAGDLPPEIAQAERAKGESGVIVFEPLPAYADAFDHIELRWERCQTVLPRPYGYTPETLSAPPSEVSVTALIDALRTVAQPRQKRQQKQAAEPRQPAAAPRQARSEPGNNVIGLFNQRYTVDEILERNGYTWNGNGWVHPNTSQPDVTGVKQAGDKVQSFSATDPLNNGHNHDPFSLFLILEHGDDMPAAIKAAADTLGLPPPTRRLSDPFIVEDGIARCRCHNLPLQQAHKGHGLYGRDADGQFCTWVWAEDLKGIAVGPLPPTDNATDKDKLSDGARFAIRFEDELDQVQQSTWALKDEVISRGYHLIYGPSGSKKTFYAVRRALELARLGLRVLYVATEDLAGLRYRVSAWRALNRDAVGTKLAWLSAGAAIGAPEVDLTDSTSVEALVDAILPYGFDHITIDTLREAHSGDENSSQDGRTINRAVQRLIAAGASVDVVHHSGVESQRPRGTTAIFGNADMVIKVISDPDERDVTIHYDKVRNTAPLPDKFFVLTDTTVSGIDSRPVPALLSAEKISRRGFEPLKRTHKAILEALALSIFATTGAKQRELVQSVEGINERSLFRALSTLKDRGFISQGQKGDPYFITPEGRAQLGSEFLTPTDTTDISPSDSSDSTDNSAGNLTYDLTNGFERPHELELQSSNSADNVWYELPATDSADSASECPTDRTDKSTDTGDCQYADTPNELTDTDTTLWGVSSVSRSQLQGEHIEREVPGKSSEPPDPLVRVNWPAVREYLMAGNRAKLGSWCRAMWKVNELDVLERAREMWPDLEYWKLEGAIHDDTAQNENTQTRSVRT